MQELNVIFIRLLLLLLYGSNSCIFSSQIPTLVSALLQNACTLRPGKLQRRPRFWVSHGRKKEENQRKPMTAPHVAACKRKAVRAFQGRCAASLRRERHGAAVNKEFTHDHVTRLGAEARLLWMSTDFPDPRASDGRNVIIYL